MIETIYNAENNEEEAVKLPKNIHQIGSGETKYHIYIEDKVSRFLELLPEDEKNIRYGVLLGSVKFSKGEVYMFIRSAVEVREVIENTLIFGDDVWTGIYDDIKKYYHGDKIVGWYASMEEFEERDLFHMRKLHLDHFAGNDKVFLNINREEEEKEFYFYANGDLQKVKCYHIYYEKNQELEQYIFETHYDLTSRKKNVKTKSEEMPEKKPEHMASEAEKEEENGKAVSDAGEEESIEAESGDISKKLMMFSGRAASVFVVGALVFTIGVMYRKGQLDHLATEMKEVVANIMNKGDTSDADNVVLLDENKKPKKEQEDSQDKDKTESTTEENTAGESITGEEDASGQDSTEENTSGQDSTGENASGQDSTEQNAISQETPEETAAVSPPATQYYEVQQGDTLYGICQKLYGNANNIQIIMDLNNLESPDSITYGKKLIVP